MARTSVTGIARTSVGHLLGGHHMHWHERCIILKQFTWLKCRQLLFCQNTAVENNKDLHTVSLLHLLPVTVDSVSITQQARRLAGDMRAVMRNQAHCGMTV